jgi:uncharacterized membrane protein
MWSSVLASHWRREVLRTSLWFVPAMEVVGAIGLFVLTTLLDRAAYHGAFRTPDWVISGTADAAREILTAIAAALITVVGVVFSIILVTLTLASTQFGPRMLRNFIRDRGTQLTLGTFVATFVYSVLVLVSIGNTFVPHIGVTVTLGLMVADLGVLIYFIHHTAISIQLPQVIASIAKDLAGAIAIQGDSGTAVREQGPSAVELLTRAEQGGGVLLAPTSGYLQFIKHQDLVRVAAEANAVICLEQLSRARAPVRDRLAADGRRGTQEPAGPRARRRLAPDADPGRLVRHRPAGGDSHPCPLRRGQRHVHGDDLH